MGYADSSYAGDPKDKKSITSIISLLVEELSFDVASNSKQFQH